MVVDPGAFTMFEERRMPATTLQAWRRFVVDDPLEFVLLSHEVWLALGDAERDRYDEARVTCHSELVIVETPAIREILHQGRLLTLVNRREISARRGLIVSGPWATGKSTAIRQLGRSYELRVRQRFPGQDRIPVVYVSAPPNGSPRKLATRFARFPGLPLKNRHNEMDIADAVCDILTEAGCELVLVDEIHNINLATSAGKDLSDHLKCFTENIPATFVYAGINVEREGLFTGVRGKQIASRCVMMHTGNFPCQSGWRSIIASMESRCGCTATSRACSPNRPATSTNAPAEASAACHTWTAPPRSAQSPTAPNRSPASCSRPSPSTTTPRSTGPGRPSKPTPPPREDHEAPEDTAPAHHMIDADAAP